MDETGAPVTAERGLAKPDVNHVLMHSAENGRFISFFGDLHPSFFGNVVKAMGGAKRGYPVVSHALAAQPGSAISGAELIARCRQDLVPTVHAVKRLTPTIVEVVVHAPARRARSGRGSSTGCRTTRCWRGGCRGGRREHGLAMEGLAMTGAWTDTDAGLVSVIVLEMGGSSDLCAMLKPGEPVVLMGPTGTPTEIHADTTVALSAAALQRRAFLDRGGERAAGSKSSISPAISRSATVTKSKRSSVPPTSSSGAAMRLRALWRRDRRTSFVGNIVQAMHAYGGELEVAPCATI